MEDEDADMEELEHPCTKCQMYKKQLEQEMQHTARLQREVCTCYQTELLSLTVM